MCEWVTRTCGRCADSHSDAGLIRMKSGEVGRARAAAANCTTECATSEAAVQRSRRSTAHFELNEAEISSASSAQATRAALDPQIDAVTDARWSHDPKFTAVTSPHKFVRGIQLTPPQRAPRRHRVVGSSDMST